MKTFAISGLTALLVVTPLAADPQPVQAVPTTVSAPVTQFAESAAKQVSEVATTTSQEIEEVKKMFEQLQTEVNKNTSPDVREILAMGTGAGLGFLASGFIMTAWIAPLTASLSSSLGLSQAATGIVTASVTTIGLVSGTYAGGIYGRNLVAD